MGNYNFETAPNRLGQHTYKWKEAENDREVLAAWIADMDFEVLPEVRQTVTMEIGRASCRERV